MPVGSRKDLLYNIREENADGRRQVCKQLLETGAPFAPWHSVRNLFVGTSKTLEETLKESRRRLDLIMIHRVRILWRIP